MLQKHLSLPFEKFQTPWPGLTMGLWSEPRLPLPPGLYSLLPTKLTPTTWTFLQVLGITIQLPSLCLHIAPWWNTHGPLLMQLIPVHPPGFSGAVFLPESCLIPQLSSSYHHTYNTLLELSLFIQGWPIGSERTGNVSAFSITVTPGS